MNSIRWAIAIANRAAQGRLFLPAGARPQGDSAGTIVGRWAIRQLQPRGTPIHQEVQRKFSATYQAIVSASAAVNRIPGVGNLPAGKGYMTMESFYQGLLYLLILLAMLS